MNYRAFFLIPTSGLLRVGYKLEKLQQSRNLLALRHLQCFLTWSYCSCQVYLLVQVSCQYRYWFWSYENVCLEATRLKIWKYEFFPIPGDRGKFDRYQIWHEYLWLNVTQIPETRNSQFISATVSNW